MTVDIGTLFGVTLAYLGLLFIIAEATERPGSVLHKVARHPLAYGLSLGVYATSWTFYGSTGFAQAQGFGYIAIGLGVALSCLLIPVLWLPVLRIVRRYQLSSLADLFAFRYQSQSLGMLVTVLMLAGSLPYLALQFRAVSDSTALLSGGADSRWIGLVYCIVITLFAVLFGARHTISRKQHPGLITAIAFESLVKTVAILSVSAVAIWGVFGSFSDLDQWLADHPEMLTALYQPVQQESWITFLLLAFFAGFLLPRQFHMAFVECPGERSLLHAAWTLPLLLLLVHLGVPAVLWAGTELEPHGNADFYVLTLASQYPWLAVLAFLGGVSASSAMIIVSSLALSTMVVNHIALPLRPATGELYRRLRWTRRLVISAVTLAGFALYAGMQYAGGLVGLGLISFVMIIQFVPGLLGALFWKNATSTGVLVGLSGATVVWFLILVPPLFVPSWQLDSMFATDRWTSVTSLSLVVNVGFFIAVSMYSQKRPQEQQAAAACMQQDAFSDADIHYRPQSRQALEERLAPFIGAHAANVEVRRALDDLGFADRSLAPMDLLRLWGQLERNLSGLVGPLLARAIVGRTAELDHNTQMALADLMRYVDQRSPHTEASFNRLTRQVELVRRYLRSVLEDLPVGICALGPGGDIVVWNAMLTQLTGLSETVVTGSRVPAIPAPWGEMLANIYAEGQSSTREVKVPVYGTLRTVRISTSAVESAGHLGGAVEQLGGWVMIVEDLTERRQLEASMAHQGRLASIGRFAAGIAHEIGNPITAIMMVAQNLRREFPGTVSERLEPIIDAVRRIRAILSSLQTFSRTGRPQADITSFVPVTIANVVDDAIRLVALSGRARSIQLSSQCPLSLQVLGDAQLLSQVFVNLLSNACDASSPESRVVVSAAATDHKRAWIAVTDQGSGIPDEIREHIFDPFVTTKDPGQGSGLGLAITYSIVHEHGGDIWVDSEVGRGTSFVMYLPRVAEFRITSNREGDIQ
ncbi:MAG: ATP-binding protein [Proteobacteria bacterium]|nr:ATP-binding protein [Pseudomonadota bacterium]